jgi:hypothetical protein
MKFPRTYDATITRADFLRLLPAATGETGFTEQDGLFRGHCWSLRFSPISPLEIGMVRLERHRVEIAFEGMTPEAEETFMQRFTLYYQRGGG